MKTLRALISAFDVADVPIAVFCVALILIAYGASRIHDGLGALAVGVILVLYVKPLVRWVK